MAEMAVIGLSLKWRQLCVCSLIDLGSRPMKSWKEVWLLYNKRCSMTLDFRIRNPANRVILRHHLARDLVKCTIVYFDGCAVKIPMLMKHNTVREQ